MIAKVSTFFSNVRGELEKVTWPTKKDTYSSTVVVLVFVLLVAIFLWAVDSVLAVLVRMLLS